MILFVLETFDNCFKRLVIFTLVLLHAKNHVAIHLHKTTITIPREARILCRVFQRDDGFVVEAEIQNRVHHARHRIARTGANRNEQRHPIRRAEFRAHDLFHVGDARFHLRLQFLRISFFVCVKKSADFGGDGKTGRHGQTDAGHFGEVRALAAEQRLHAPVAVGFFVAPSINIFRGFSFGHKFNNCG